MKLDRFYEIYGLYFEGGEERTKNIETEVAQLEADHKFVIERENKVMVEFSRLVRYVRANHIFGMNADPDKSMELAKKSTTAYNALSDETRARIEEAS